MAPKRISRQMQCGHSPWALLGRVKAGTRARSGRGSRGRSRGAGKGKAGDAAPEKSGKLFGGGGFAPWPSAVPSRHGTHHERVQPFFFFVR